MIDKKALSPGDVATLLEAATREAQSQNWQVSIAVVDDGGHLLGFTRTQGATPASVYISQAKARTAAMGQRDSKFYEDMLNAGRPAFLSAPGLECLLEGGVPVLAGGQCLGGVGVSGVKSHEDALVAKAGIIAALSGSTS
jgi:uncharacterized protein GlcG (DUF336 family)